MGDTGLKNGLVELQARGGGGGVEWGGVVTYFADRTGTILQALPLNPGKCLCVCVSVFK